jgi:hypothetical protein
MARTIAALMVAALIAACSSGSASPTGASVASTPSAPSADASAPTTDASEAAGGAAPQACDLLTPDEIAGVVGNAVEGGTGTTASDCLWSADPEETSAAVLILAVPATACEAALDGDAAQSSADGFDVPAFWLWAAASGGVGTLSLCTAESMITVTVSAGLSDTPDEGAIRAQASALGDLVLSRI